jgi:hypothetical protein
MNCQDIAALLDENGCERLSRTQRRAVSLHTMDCDDCCNARRAVQELRLLGQQPIPSPRSDLFREAVSVATSVRAAESRRARSAWRAAGVAVALAASVVVAILVVAPANQSSDGDRLTTVAIALHETRDVTVAIDARNALSGAEIQVSMSGGIELAGFAGQRSVRWNADLAAGTNTLRLPVSVMNADGGRLLVAVAHQGKRREFQIRVLGDNSNAAAIGI